MDTITPGRRGAIVTRIGLVTGPGLPARVDAIRREGRDPAPG